MTLNNTNYGYLLSIETPINHPLFMDDITFYDKTERELQSLAHTIQTKSKYIDLEFGMKICCTVRIKKEKFVSGGYRDGGRTTNEAN